MPWVLCDVTSRYALGQAMDLAFHGYSRDRKKGQEADQQIIVGLLPPERPIGVEGFAGNTADPGPGCASPEATKAVRLEAAGTDRRPRSLDRAYPRGSEARRLGMDPCARAASAKSCDNVQLF